MSPDVNWCKLGRVYCAAGERDWQRSHAYCPTPFDLGDGRLRVFCAFLDADAVGRAGWVDVDAGDPTRVLGVSPDPVLDIGDAGTFDDAGVTPLSVVRDGEGRLRMYYAGWQRHVRTKYSLFLGLAVSDDDGASFVRARTVPVLDRCDGQETVRSSGHVRRDGGAWRLWYAGGGEWVTDPADGSVKPRYALRHLLSEDGIRFDGPGELVLAPVGEDEIGFARPYVLASGDRLRMWYSLRTFSRGYRIGYAESADGRRWVRRDEAAGIDVSATGWDSEMVGLSAIAAVREGTYLFYNGNDYGRTGFGVAVADGL